MTGAFRDLPGKMSADLSPAQAPVLILTQRPLDLRKVLLWMVMSTLYPGSRLS